VVLGYSMPSRVLKVKHLGESETLGSQFTLFFLVKDSWKNNL